MEGFNFDLSAILSIGLSATTVLLLALVANFRGYWYSGGAVDRIVKGYEKSLEEKDTYIDALQDDMRFYRDLLFRVDEHQNQLVDIAEKSLIDDDTQE